MVWGWMGVGMDLSVGRGGAAAACRDTATPCATWSVESRSGQVLDSHGVGIPWVRHIHHMLSQKRLFFIDDFGNETGRGKGWRSASVTRGKDLNISNHQRHMSRQPASCSACWLTTIAALSFPSRHLLLTSSALLLTFHIHSSQSFGDRGSRFA
jgi:hypothetical protein